MDWKVVSAFATGAVLASGLVYFGVKPADVVLKVAPPPLTLQVAAAPPVPMAHVQPQVPRAPVHEKRSPMPPARRQKQVLIARNNPLPTPPAPSAAFPAEPPPPLPTPLAPPSPAEQAAPPPVPVENVSLPVPNAEARVPHTVTLAAGTSLAVRIGETISSSHNQPGDTFLATLTQPLVIDGFIIAERGARIEGRVLEASPTGRARGVSHLAVSIVRLATADGQNIRIRTEPYTKDGASATGTDAAKVGAGAVIGAVIGAIAGGDKGAAIGAGAGGVVGAGDVLLTRGKPVEIVVETRINFRVQDPVTITERLD